MICSVCGGWYLFDSPMSRDGADNIGMDHNKQCPRTCIPAPVWCVVCDDVAVVHVRDEGHTCASPRVTEPT